MLQQGLRPAGLGGPARTHGGPWRRAASAPGAGGWRGGGGNAGALRGGRGSLDVQPDEKHRCFLITRAEGEGGRRGDEGGPAHARGDSLASAHPPAATRASSTLGREPPPPGGLFC